MLYHPTVEKLAELRLAGMRQGLLDQQNLPDVEQLSFEERLGLLLDREASFRDERRLQYRWRNARLRQSAVIEDLDRRPPRGLDHALMNRLIAGPWIKKRFHLLSPAPPARARPGSPARSATKPAATASAPNTTACPGCSTNSATLRATDAIRRS